jgi:hypothetical protein
LPETEAQARKQDVPQACGANRIARHRFTRDDLAVTEDAVDDAIDWLAGNAEHDILPGAWRSEREFETEERNP